MTITAFFKFVELPTKIASIFPFLLGTLYTLYHFNTLDVTNMFLMFGSLLLFDMATTGLNNYIDYKHAIKKHGFNYESHNAIVAHKLSPTIIQLILAILITTASILGLILFLRTSYVVLALGIISFVIGILYSYGPIPISRLPLGELFSGLFMGFLIPFMSILIHVPSLVTFEFNHHLFSLHVLLPEVIGIGLVSLVPICTIANIMLANNICDIDDDLANKRYTLPIFIGKSKALIVFRSLYYSCYIAIIVGILLGYLPFSTSLVLISFPIIKENIHTFMASQTKQHTFICAIKNFITLNSLYVIALSLSLLFK
ncbi:MAG: 1,4-dihydroxy-2-naphthoate polyprenyltransferase [Cellulosilyticaceae bacterium]